ncbi:MAG TPA: hypothetical protein VK636_22015, partial [Gemmatimonadaceae bacterium]|nr:hypothetical protein [Gemmatimonadaceae bacterium]
MFGRLLRGLLFGLAIAVTASDVCPPRVLQAQQADVIRGRITSDDGAPLNNANVQLTSIPNNVKKTAT